MKCPKCGFQSFNYLATCKKCGRDLSEMRDKYRLGDPILPIDPAGQPTGSARPVVDDPFETTLPDEEDISSTAGLASLEDEEVDTELADYFDEIGGMDPELAATLDPDADWDPSTPGFDTLVMAGEETADPIHDGDQPSLDDEDLFPALDPQPEPANDPFAETEEEEPPVVPKEKAEAAQDTGEYPFPEEDVDLDDWLLDGEEPSWRRPSSGDFDGGEDGVFACAAEDLSAGATTETAATATFPFYDQAELPFERDETLPPAPPRRASLAARLFAFILDLGVLLATFALFVLAGEYLRTGAGVFRWPQPQALAAQAGPYFLVFFGLAFGYFTLFHYLGGQTPGKMAARLLVVDTDGEPLHLSQAFLRTAGGLVCLLPIGLGFCSALFHRNGRGWNDRLAGSMVIPLGGERLVDTPGMDNGIAEQD